MEEFIKLKIFEKITQIRKEETGLTQKAFAERLGININTCEKYEKRSVPDAETLQKICNLPERKIRPAWVLFDEAPQYVDMVNIEKGSENQQCSINCSFKEKEVCAKLIEILRHDDEIHKDVIEHNINFFKQP